MDEVTRRIVQETREKMRAEERPTPTPRTGRVLVWVGAAILIVVVVVML